MNTFLYDVLFSLITGIVSSVLVVIYYERRDYKKHRLSEAHILDRFTTVLFQILTTIRTTAKLPHPRAGNEEDAFQQLEEILGRKNPSIVMERLSSFSPDQHKALYEQLLQSQHTLQLLFSDSVAHKTIEGSVSASVAEMRVWIQDTLTMYHIFPELFDNQTDSIISMKWMASVANLTENSFTILKTILSMKKVPDGILRFGSRGA